MIDSQTIDRDLSCYQQMLKSLTSYQNGEIDLYKLMADMEGLLNMLELASNEWKEEFRIILNDFELVRAMVLDRTPPELDARDKNIILETINQLKLLVEKKIEG